MKFRVCLLSLAFFGAAVVETGASANGSLYFSLSSVGEFDTFLIQYGTSKRPLGQGHPSDKAFEPLCRNCDVISICCGAVPQLRFWRTHCLPVR